MYVFKPSSYFGAGPVYIITNIVNQIHILVQVLYICFKPRSYSNTGPVYMH